MILEEKASKIKELSLRILCGCTREEFKEAMCFVPVMTALYNSVLRLCPAEPLWPDRDRLITAGFPCRAVQLAALVQQGTIPPEQLTPETPEMAMPGIDFFRCTLSDAPSTALASALRAREDIKIYKSFLLISQAQCLQGRLWEMAIAASENLLEDLTVILCRPSGDILPGADNICAKFSAFGFDTLSVDSGSPDAVAMALLLPRRSHKPLFVCCDV